jgi:hypothetical protein
MWLRRRAGQEPLVDVTTAGQPLLPADPALLADDDLSLAVPSYLQLPAPARLALTAGWNLAESLALPVVAYLVGERLGGDQGAGMAAATVVIWLTALARKLLTGNVPGLLMITGLVLTLQTVLVVTTGSVLLFLLQFPVANLALCIFFARTAPTGKPLVAQLAAEVVALRSSAAHPGLDRFFRGVTWLWAGIFAASTIGLAALLVLEPAAVFLWLTTVVTVAGVAAGTVASVLWFVRMLRRSGLRVRFGQA